MILYLLNDSFEKIRIIDSYTSIIWTTRYQEAGEFELYLPARDSNEFECGQFLQREDGRIMTIESVEFTTDEEAGDYCTLTGKSIEQILSNRIVWNKSQLFGRVENSIYRIVDENLINADDSDRNISGLTCAKSKGILTSGSFIYNGETLLDAIIAMCQTYNFGFRIIRSNGTLTFEVYQGVNRSYTQNENPYVIFSPDFDNLSKSTYTNEISNYKNVCLAYSETDNGIKKMSSGTGTGIHRRETFVDTGTESANDVMQTKADEVLSSASKNEIFECEIESTYEYQKDYFLGDIVQIQNEYGITAAAQIMEIIENDDESGYTCIPTFKTLEV